MRSVRAIRIAVVLLLLVGLAAAASRSGLIDLVKDEDRLRTNVEDAGALGPLLFLLLMTALVPLNVPGIIFTIPATALFGTIGGIALALLGGFLASVIGVLLARRLGARVVAERLPPRLRRIEQRVSASGFWGVVLLRTFTYLLQPADWLCGVSSIPTRTVLAGTFVGLILPTCAIALSGGGLLGAL